MLGNLGRWRRAAAAAGIAAAGAATAVAIAAPQQFVGLTVSGTVSQPLTATVATFKSDGTITDATGYSATIGWGDSTHSTGTVVRKEPYTSPPFFSVTGAHTYAAAGDRTTTIIVKQGAQTVTTNGLARIATVPAATTPTTPTTPTQTTPTTPTTTTPPPAPAPLTNVIAPPGPALRLRPLSGRVRAGHRVRLRAGGSGRAAFSIWRLGGPKAKRKLIAIPGAPDVVVRADAVTRHPWLDVAPKKKGALQIEMTAVDAHGATTELNSTLFVGAAGKAEPHGPAIALGVDQPWVVEGTPVHASVDVLDKGCCKPSPKSKVKVSIDWGDGAATDGAEGSHAFVARQQGGYTITAKVTTPNGTTTQDFDLEVDPNIDPPALCGHFDLEGTQASLPTDSMCMAPFWSGTGGFDQFLAPAGTVLAVDGLTLMPPKGASLLYDRDHSVVKAYPFGSGPVSVHRFFGPEIVHADTLQFGPDEGGGTLMSGGTISAPIVADGLTLTGDALVHMPPAGVPQLEAPGALPQPFQGSVPARVAVTPGGLPLQPAALGGRGRSGGAKAHAASFDLTIPDVAYGPVEAQDVHLVSDDTGLHGSGKLNIEGSQLEASFDFGPGGEFQGARVFVGAEVPIFPMVALTNIDLALTLDPFHFQGQGDLITNGPLELFGHPLLRYHGCFDIAVPHKGQTTRLCNAVAPYYYDYTEPFDHEVIVSLTGSGKIIDLFDTQWSAVTVRTGGDDGPVVGFASGYDLHFPSAKANLFSFDGSFGALVYGLSFDKWQLSTDNKVCLLDLKCIGISAIVSSKGISGCVGPAGGYYLWNHAWGVSLIGCKFGKHYGSKAKVATALPSLRDALAGRAPGALAAAGGGLRVRLGRGVQSLRLDGVGGAPRVLVTGPGGFRFADDGTGRTTAAAQVMHSEARDVVRDGKSQHMDGTDQTFLTLLHARPGTYTVAAQPGSPSIASYAVAGRARPPVIRARVAGGRLVYRIVRGVPGTTVTFAEVHGREQHVLGRARGRAGSIAFTPALARRAQRRRIVARVEDHGVPAGQLTVGAYVARPAPRPGAPRVIVRRAGARLVVRWTPVPGARRYALRVALSGGRVLTPATRATRFTVADAGRGAGARVAVTAIDATGRAGAPGRATLKASRAGRPTLLL